MLAAVICERMGWTWQEYWEQPDSFLRVIIEKYRAEADVASQRQRRAKQGLE
jgi:hypothetical protein